MSAKTVIQDYLHTFERILKVFKQMKPYANGIVCAQQFMVPCWMATQKIMNVRYVEIFDSSTKISPKETVTWEKS